MLQGLTDKLQRAFWKLRSKGRLTEGDVDAALRDIRLSLLEADVNFKVVKDFIDRIKERAVGEKVLDRFTPGQQVIKIVYEELVNLLGSEHQPLVFSKTPPTVIMLVGLQGTGKTTTAGKLASRIKKQGRRPVLLACDIRRPAAIEQLQQVGERVGVEVFQMGTKHHPADIAKAGLSHAKARGFDVVIADTGGRLHTDDEMMREVKKVKEALQPHEVLLVVDAMTGQDAVNSAVEFERNLGLTGFILTKVDSDARGGAVLSIRAVTGKPVKFVGTGEHLSELDEFYPDRMATRILGMGDVQTLIEKAEQAFDEEQAQRMERRILKGEFGLDDLLEQLRMLTKSGPLDQFLRLLPGFSGLGRMPVSVDEKQLRRMEAVILSMTPKERRHPEIIDGSRKRRIARGSGTSVQDVNMLLRQFKVMKNMMKQMAKANLSDADVIRMMGL